MPCLNDTKRLQKWNDDEIYARLVRKEDLSFILNIEENGTARIVKVLKLTQSKD